MEPRQYEALPNVEQAPVQSGESERILSQDPERSVEASVERAPGVGELRGEVAQIAMPSLPAPVLSVPDPSAQVAVADDTTPLSANDDDLIEKEWVDKAKSIIAATKDNPYKRESEISKLQIEYIRKRYGRVIGESGD